jgi:enterobacterial common antigen flippase
MNKAVLPPAGAPAGGTTDLASRMLWVTTGMGLSAGAVLLLAAIRTKMVAVELGPTGVGSLALLVSFVGFASVAAELGIGNGAVREIAAAQSRGDQGKRDAYRRALRMSAVVLALVGAAVVAFLARPIARDLLHEPGLVDETRLSAFAVAGGVLSAAAMGELRGFRRVRELALLPVLAGLIATAAVLLAYAFGVSLIPVVIVAPPVGLAALAWISARGLPPLRGRVRTANVVASTRRIVGLGLAFVAAAGASALGALLLRLLINSRLGTADTGEFQAAFAVASSSLSFLFAALATDYMPLLSGLADDRPQLNRAANTQLQVALLVATPSVMVLIAAAPAVVTLLYSSAFHDTAGLLRIMLVGDMFRLAAWTLGYILIARRASWLFVAAELLYNCLLIVATVSLISPLGLEATAVAYVLAQVASLAWTLALVRWTSGFQLSATNAGYIGGLAAALLVVYVCATSGGLVQIVGWATAAACTYAAIRRLATMANVSLSGLRRLGLRRVVAAARRGA